MTKPNKSNLKSKPLSRRTRAILWGTFLYALSFATCAAIGVYAGVAVTAMLAFQLTAVVSPVFFLGTLASFALIKKVRLASLIENLEKQDGHFEKNFNRFLHQNNVHKVLCAEKDTKGQYQAVALISKLSMFNNENFEENVLALIDLIEPGEVSKGVINAILQEHYFLCDKNKIINALFEKFKKNITGETKAILLVTSVAENNHNMIALLKKHGATPEKIEEINEKFKERQLKIQLSEQKKCAFPEWVVVQWPEEKIKPPKQVVESKKTGKTVKSAVSVPPVQSGAEIRKHSKKAKAK